MTKYAFLTIVAFIASSIWLYFAWAHANRTNGWTPAPAKFVSIEKQRRSHNRAAQLLSRVSYSFDGQKYEAVVDEYLIGNEITVYVNPDDPSEVVGVAGARMQDVGRPLVFTIASGLFAVVLVLIAFSPKEDK
jgi:hypothetical protein